ncbi:MAG: hybrid sensor histidine kinase/response regulator transcription factor, partial [Bacteroidales bacterium]
MKGKLIKKKLLPFSLLGCLFILIPSQLAFTIERDKCIHFSDVDGLPRNIITCIEQDKYGYTWVGTRNGVSRFDGFEFKNYEQLRGQVINHLLIDNNSNLWVASRQGLFFFNRIKDDFELKFSGSVNNLFKYSGEVYFSDNFNIMKIAPKGISEVIEESDIRSFCKTSEGFWIGAGSSGVIFKSTNNNQTKTILKEKSVHVVREINRSIFIGCNDGELFVYNFDQGLKKISIKNHHTIKEIIEIDNEIWLATDGNGIIILDKQLNYNRSINRSNDKKTKLISNSIYDIYLGSDNEVWIGTYGAGLFCLKDDNSPFRNIIPEPGNRNSLLAREGVSALKINSKILFGTNYGLSVLNENTGNFTHLRMNRLMTDLRGAKVTAINTDHDNSFWIGTYDGLLGKYTSDLEHIKTYQPCGEKATDMQRIIFIHKCRTNNLLIATHYRNRELVNFNLDNETFTPFSLSTHEINPYFQIKSLRENREGEVLALLINRGIYSVNQEKNTLDNNFPEINKRITFPLNDFYEDTKGYYWLATQSQGLVRMSKNGRDFDKWTTEQGLPTNTLLRIETSDDKYLWISTIDGLLRFEMETGNTLVFNHQHGLPGNEFIARSSVKTDDGRLIFGGGAGFTFINPESVQPDNSESEVIISDITFHNQSIKEIDNKPLLKAPIEETKELCFPFKRNSFTIHFFSKDKDLPKYNNYKYRLVGLEDNWIYLGETKHTTYTNLSPGKYIFEVKNTNKSNVWSSNTKQLFIQISPPWYLSWYAIVGYILFLVGLISGAMYFYAYRIKLKKEIEISEIKIKAEHDLTEKKLSFFTNISHDLKTPLTLIDAPVNELLRSDIISETQKEKLLIIRRNSQRLYKLITDLLDFRKLSNNQLPLKVSETNIEIIIENIYQAFREEFKNKSIEFERSSTVNENVYVDSKKIEKILWNLISNALKFTETDGEVFLSAEEEHIDNKVYLKLIVKDSGIGIPKQEQDKIFNRFYQYKKNEGPTTKGTGIGLSIVKDLVELHHGNITLGSMEGVGTTFVITIPAERKFFTENEIEPEKSEKNILPRQDIFKKDLSEATNNKSKGYNLPKMLLVEDNKELREYLVGYFVKNFRVYSAEDGQEGLKLAKEKTPDIIITDILMPNMNGYEFCKAIRNNFDISHIPLVILTCNSDNEQQIEGLSTGADAYITKPFSIDLLDASVNSILENRKKLRNRFLGVGQIDQIKNKLTHRDSEFIDVLKSFIDDNLSNHQLNIETLAEHFAISRTQLNRKIKSLTGQTPNNLIKSIRLKKAYELIKNEGLRVSEASYKVGFTDPNYFTICFSKE